MNKTNAMRILEKEGIPFSTVEYEPDSDHVPGRGLAQVSAAKTGIPAERVFKTIVMRADSGEILVFCVPASREVNLKKARQAAGVKSLSPLKAAELPAATGYIRGGCSPIGMKKRFRTFADRSALSLPSVFVSAGTPGIQLELAPEDLIRAARSEVADIADSCAP